MNHYIIILFVFLSLSAFSQNNEELFKEKLLKADSIWLVSHDFEERTSRAEALLKTKPLNRLVINDTLNFNSIKEHVKIKDTLISQLYSVLFDINEDSVSESAFCFEPHHAILIFKDESTSYVDICFGCQHVNMSKDIKQVEIPFSNQRWNDFESFFLQQGLTYEMPKRRK